MKPFMLRKKKKLVAVARRKILSARMGDTRDYRMTTIDSVLRRSLDDRSGELILTLDPHFQGLPDTAHGGSVLAAFDALAGLTGPRHVGGVYRKRVPVGVPLALTHGRTEATHTFVLRDATSVLVNGRVAPVADTRRGAPAPLGDPWLLGAGAPRRISCRYRARASRAASTIRSGCACGSSSTTRRSAARGRRASRSG